MNICAKKIKSVWPVGIPTLTQIICMYDDKLGLTLICECYSIFDRLSTKLLTFGHIINIFREGGKKMSLLVGFYYYLLVFSFNHHQGFQFGLTCKLLTSHLGILHIF